MINNHGVTRACRAPAALPEAGHESLAHRDCDQPGPGPRILNNEVVVGDLDLTQRGFLLL